MIRFVAFAVLAANCIFLVSSTPNGGELSEATLDAFNKYHNMYNNECLAATEELNQEEVEEDTLWVIDEETKRLPDLALYKDALITEMKCVQWLSKKYENDFENLKIITYLLYLVVHYTYVTVSQEEVDYIIDSKNKNPTDGVEKLRNDFRIMATILQSFRESAYRQTVKRMRNLKINRLIQDINNTKEAPQEGIKISNEDMSDIEAIFQECGINNDSLNLKRSLLSNIEKLEALVKLKEDEKTFMSIYGISGTYEDPKVVEHWIETMQETPGGHENIAPKIENIIKADMPGVDFPVRKPLFLTDADKFDLTSEFREDEPYPKSKGGSRIVNTIQYLMESKYEKKRRAYTSKTKGRASTSKTDPE